VSSALLLEAKRRLPLPQLMAQLGHGDRARTSARCPFHQDSTPSFSVYQQRDGAWAWRCHAGCGAGDEPDFLARVRGIANPDACREFIRLAGLSPAPQTLPQPLTLHPPQPNSRPFNWSLCLAAFGADQQCKLAEWRGYTPDFVAWLHAQGLLGLFESEHVALPVHSPGGCVIGCHYRRGEDGTWRYHPLGTTTRPLVVGDLLSASRVLAAESQWDALAVMDRLQWHIAAPAHTAIVITRGAGNARLLTGLCAPTATVYAFAQNDSPGERWLAAIASACGCACLRVQTPARFKDANDWSRAGATRADIEAALAAAQPFTLPPDLHASTARSLAPHAIPAEIDSEADDCISLPFPTHVLPPAIAQMVRAVARVQRVPEALPALVALGLVSASIGGGLAVQSILPRPLRGNLFIVGTAASGCGKTESFRALATPLLARQEGIQERWQTVELPRLQAELRSLDARLKRLDRDIAKKSDPTEIERLRGQMEFFLARRNQITSQLNAPLLVTQDTTVERLAVLLQHNGEVMFSTSSDARKLVDNLLGRYSSNKLTDESLYLCGFSGDHVRVDRQGRDPVALREPCISILWLLQPDALEMLLGEASLYHGGFLARCLVAHTQAQPERIEGEPVQIPDPVQDAWASLVDALLTAYRLPEPEPTAPLEEPEVDL